MHRPHRPCSIQTLPAILSLLVLITCVSGAQDTGYRVADYEAALAATEGIPSPVAGSAVEKRATAGFRSLFADFSEEGMRRSAGRVYADDAYLNDTVKTVRGAEAIAEYLAHGASRVHRVNVTMHDLSRSGRDYYFRWVMEIQLKADEEPIRSIGISQVRFNRAGRVVFHQDFWDSANGLFDFLPGSGFFIKFYRNRM